MIGNCVFDNLHWLAEKEQNVLNGAHVMLGLLNTMVSLIFASNSYRGFNETHSFKDTYISGPWSYQSNLLVEIALQWTFIFIDQLHNKSHDDWYVTNIDETTVLDKYWM